MSYDEALSLEMRDTIDTIDKNNVTHEPLRLPPTSHTALGILNDLVYLSQVDQLLVFQVREMAELFLCCEFKNKYKICNTMGQQVFFAEEETDCCTRNCLGSLRCLTMMMKNNFEQEVLRFERPCRCDGCFCPCFLQEFRIYGRGGQYLGCVKQTWSIFYPHFDILDSTDEVVLKIRGPCCQCRCRADVRFSLLSKDLTREIGMISKQWAGVATEVFLDADNFVIKFPMNLDVSLKAVLLGACFLIDFMYFER